jgi:hypothetical protein
MPRSSRGAGARCDVGSRLVALWVAPAMPYAGGLCSYVLCSAVASVCSSFSSKPAQTSTTKTRAPSAGTRHAHRGLPGYPRTTSRKRLCCATSLRRIVRQSDRAHVCGGMPRPAHGRAPSRRRRRPCRQGHRRVRSERNRSCTRSGECSEPTMRRETALMKAIEAGCTNTAAALIFAGADLSAVNNNGCGNHRAALCVHGRAGMHTAGKQRMMSPIAPARRRSIRTQ